MASFLCASPELRLVAAFTTKCGSQSIRHWLASAVEEATGERIGDPVRLRVDARRAASLDDHHKVFFVRDPLARLVSFYLHWVVIDDERWCFADEDRRLTLRGKTFREALFAVRHMHEHGIRPQHHLVAQYDGIDGIEFDEVVAVEDLERGLVGLNHRLGIHVPIPNENRLPYRPELREPMLDRRPEELAAEGFGLPELFYDGEARRIALDAYAADVAFYRRTTGRRIIGDDARANDDR